MCNFHVQGIMPVFFAWRLLEWLQSYDGIKFGLLKAHLFIQDKYPSTHTCILWDVVTRGVINSVCSPLLMIELFHNLPNFRCSYRWWSRNIFFSANIDVINWLVHYWNEGNLPPIHVCYMQFSQFCSSSRQFDAVNYLMFYGLQCHPTNILVGYLLFIDVHYAFKFAVNFLAIYLMNQVHDSVLNLFIFSRTHDFLSFGLSQYFIYFY